MDGVNVQIRGMCSKSGVAIHAAAYPLNVEVVAKLGEVQVLVYHTVPTVAIL